MAAALAAGLIVGALGTTGATAMARPVHSAAVGQSEGPCEWLAQGRLKYPTAGEQRVTFAVADAYRQTEVVLTSCVRTDDGGYAQEWDSAAFAGSAGFGRPGLIEVDSLMSPTGSFTVTEAFGREDPGTGLAYNTLRRDSYWGANAGENFNQYFEGNGAWPDEDLWRFMRSGLYEQAAVINYNRLPDMQPVAGASHAIFLHAGFEETWGCISTDLGTVTRYLRTAAPGDRFVMGVRDALFDPPSPHPSSGAPAERETTGTGQASTRTTGGWGLAALAGGGLALLGGLVFAAVRKRGQAR